MERREGILLVSHGGLRHILTGHYSSEDSKEYVFVTDEGHEVDTRVYDQVTLNPPIQKINEINNISEMIGGVLLYVGKIT